MVRYIFLVSSFTNRAGRIKKNEQTRRTLKAITNPIAKIHGFSTRGNDLDHESLVPVKYQTLYPSKKKYCVNETTCEWFLTTTSNMVIIRINFLE